MHRCTRFKSCLEEEIVFYVAFNSLSHVTTRKNPKPERNSLSFANNYKGLTVAEATVHRIHVSL